MSNPQGKFQLELLGAFRLIGPDGARINVTSRRARALLAMLATVPLLVRTSTFSAIAIAIDVDFILFCFVFSLFVSKMKSSRTLKSQ